jgi:hypothetical protein
MKRAYLFTILFFTVDVISVHSQVPPLPMKNLKNCFIEVSTEYKSGEKKSITRKFTFKKKENCEKMNRILSDNMNPSKIKHVETKMRWEDK